MQFSVVIPTFNRAKLLARTLESVWSQRFTDYEIVVVDDGSSDGTQAYLHSLDDKVRVVTQSNKGPGAARNTGIRHATGEYVALLDSDDIWFPWTLDTFAKTIEMYQSPCIVGGQIIEFTNEAELISLQEEAYRASWFSDYIASSDFPYYVGSG